MSARYLVRFDDICPEMNWVTWAKIEIILRRHDVKPLLAVVPDNRDSSLMVDVPNPSFWKSVREWQAEGWAIGLHGHQHRYSTDSGGIIGLNKRSEFAGLSREHQATKLDLGLAIFAREQVTADAWIAPGHSFDENTVRLLNSRGLRIISDGYFSKVVHYMGASWIPQQLWRFEKKHSGVWTVCYHHNAWTDADILKFEQDISKNRGDIVSMAELMKKNIPRISIFDLTLAYFYRLKILSLQRIKNLIQSNRFAAAVLNALLHRLRS